MTELEIQGEFSIECVYVRTLWNMVCPYEHIGRQNLEARTEKSELLSPAAVEPSLRRSNPLGNRIFKGKHVFSTGFEKRGTWAGDEKRYREAGRMFFSLKPNITTLNGHLSQFLEIEITYRVSVRQTAVLLHLLRKQLPVTSMIPN